jgi:hypothetical protein
VSETVKRSLSALTDRELAELFLSKSLEQDEAELQSELARWNWLYRRLEAIATELKNRPGDQRRALLAFYQHENAQVRINAAIATLAITPIQARKALEQIAQWEVGAQRVQALDTISALDNGNYVPS